MKWGAIREVAFLERYSLQVLGHVIVMNDALIVRESIKMIGIILGESLFCLIKAACL